MVLPFYVSPTSNPTAKRKTYCIGTAKKNRRGFTNFSEGQIKGLNRGVDISNVEFLGLQDTLPPVHPPIEASINDADPMDETVSTASSEVVVPDSDGDPASGSEIVAPSIPSSSDDDSPSHYPIHCFC